MSSPRLVGACFAAVLAPAVLTVAVAVLGSFAGSYLSALAVSVCLGFVFTAFIATLHLLFLGLPLYFILRDRDWINGWTAGIGGLVIGGTPSTLLLSLSLWRDGLTMQTASSLAVNFAIFGAFGMAGSLAAWATLRFGPDTPDR